MKIIQKKKENKKLKEEIENLKLTIKYYKEKIDTLNNNFKIDNDNIINDNLNNKFEDLKIEKNCNIFMLNTSKNRPLNNNKIGRNYNLENLEFINNKCKICNKISLYSIYKCVLCNNIYLCYNCYNNNNINTIHEHNIFCEIYYPKEFITQIKEKIEIDDIIDNYYYILNSIFFDKNGNLSEKLYNDFNTKKLEIICEFMKSFEADPYLYFAQYKNAFIMNELKKLEPESKIIKITLEKEAGFANILNEIIK